MRYQLFLNRYSGLLAGLLMLGNTMALQREFPLNSVQVKIESIKEPYILASGKSFHMPPGMLIFNTNNTTIVRGALPSGVIARIQPDLNGDLRRIWILNPEEIVTSSTPQPGPTEKTR